MVSPSQNERMGNEWSIYKVQGIKDKTTFWIK